MIILALGSNLGGVFGTPYQSISRALNELTASAIKIKDASRLYRTRAYSRYPQPDFLNAIATAHTPLPAHTLLEILKRIEAQAGRRELKEAHQWIPRPLDLDIVSYKGVVYKRSYITKTIRRSFVDANGEYRRSVPFAGDNAKMVFAYQNGFRLW